MGEIELRISFLMSNLIHPVKCLLTRLEVSLFSPYVSFPLCLIARPIFVYHTPPVFPFVAIKVGYIRKICPPCFHMGEKPPTTGPNGLVMYSRWCVWLPPSRFPGKLFEREPASSQTNPTTPLPRCPVFINQLSTFWVRVFL